MARRDRTIEVLQAQEQNEEQLLTLPNVIGVGTGFRQRDGAITDEVVVQVFVSRKSPDALIPHGGIVPREVTGLERRVPTDVIELPVVDAQQDNTRYRPVQGGCSIGPEGSVSAGTLGGWACDNTDNTIVLLTNNHVISNLDTQPALRRVVQPGRLDGGVLPGDVIGQLKRDISLTTTVNPPPGGTLPAVTAVDAAIGTITVGRDDDVLDIAPAIYEVQSPALNMTVQKRGRTTRFSDNGRITTIGATINITYRNRTRLGRIANAFIISSTDGNVFSNAGDSGSLIFNQAEGELAGTLPVVGLLFAGGTDASNRPITIANDINAVFGALNLSTVCTGAARALLEGALASGREAEVSDRALRRKELQFRKLRDELLRQTGGKQLAEFIQREAPRLSDAVLQDEDLFGLAVRALTPWVRKPNNFELFEAEVDRETVAALSKIAARAVRLQPDLERSLTTFAELAAAAEGKRVRDFLQLSDKPRRPRRPKKPARKRS